MSILEMYLSFLLIVFETQWVSLISMPSLDERKVLHLHISNFTEH